MNDERKTFRYMGDRPKWSGFVVPQFIVHRSSFIVSALEAASQIDNRNAKKIRIATTAIKMMLTKSLLTVVR